MPAVDRLADIAHCDEVLAVAATSTHRGPDWWVAVDAVLDHRLQLAQTD